MNTSNYAMRAESNYRTQNIIRDYEQGMAEERLLNALITKVSSRIRAWMTVTDEPKRKLTHHLASSVIG